MKRFLITTAVLAVTFVALWVNFLPVRCTGCNSILFRSSIASAMFGGHGDVVHARCFVAPEDLVPSAIVQSEPEVPAEGPATES